MRKVLIRPLITEKMTELTEREVKYGFVVDINANKVEIAKAIESKFEVDVVSVNTIRHKGKKKTQFTKKGRFTGRTPKFKKAIITLKEGQTIDIFGEA
ncbi:MAG: 50S ribosomal protein L23 [Melioribacteraceae bacterium]|nr:50S ribosomal protein L23 [Melioribacteraceae bacterium]MCF8354666.1 50S ribosomal protein L23 [Melioribacteraceae bacterium]MCF8393568.1 50S ribosomal protein L23 [Melioribacteraceae bacterium]MCF8419378.1 50S ribosomal protein L23 [Melioribacteraceae bacterium]